MKAIPSFDLAARGNSGGSVARPPQRPTSPWLQLIREAVEAVDYGTIQIKVHAGEVVQIETTRKIRVPSNVSQFHPTAPAEESSVQ